ncbi:arginine--tRNA ligase [Thioalkalivibrio sp. XN8]|uniref:arginine--tRNA ligase n=1 Tax=Thioalkalivibrio sp. XN8 TaxID=2712863 RepID=UPI0013EBD056|nr:arginine--tRNA ligase [Thioalkalivibrio sp. XN8]
MKTQIEGLLAAALEALGDQLPQDVAPEARVERTRDPRHGDFATNVALALAKPAGRNPRELAQLVVANLPASELVDEVSIAGPGFINFRLSKTAFEQEVRAVLERGADYGRSASGAGRSVIVEFVSANPTGPLHVGHGRHAAYGASVANLLAATGHEVHREYYVNDAGRQMDILAASVWLRYLEALGESFAFPANGYRGGYVQPIADQLVAQEHDRLRRPAAEVFRDLPPDAPEGDQDEYIDAVVARMRELLGEEDYRKVHALGLQEILADIRDDLAEFGVTFDRWFSERSLTELGLVAECIDRLQSDGHVYERDGALWFRASELGDEKDRVVVRDNGQTTYIASDIAYHLGKRQRGHDLLLDILGADHHGYVARVRAGLEAMGEPGDSLEVRLVQFAVLYRGGEKVQMSTRSGEFVTLRELREEVGNDAARLFYVLRSNDQHLDFDLELAKSRSNENPVYYIQYAHARVRSVFRQATEKGLGWTPAAGASGLALLDSAHERALMASLGRYPEMVELAAANRAPQNIVHYLRELAQEFHTWYNAETFLVDDAGVRAGRLALAEATRQVIANGLALVGVGAPDSM